MTCTKPEGEVGKARDDGPCSRSSHALVFAGFVGVADAVDACQTRAFDVGDGIADECGLGGVGVEGLDGFVDQVRAGFEERGVAAGAGEDRAGSIIQAVAGKVGPDGAFGIVADDGGGAAGFAAGG
jgi:hypothetical protein